MPPSTYIRPTHSLPPPIPPLLQPQPRHPQLGAGLHGRRIERDDFLQCGIAFLDDGDGLAGQLRRITDERLDLKMRDKNCSEHKQLSGLSAGGQFRLW